MKKILMILSIFLLTLSSRADILIKNDLSNTYCKTSAWAFDEDGVLSSTEDEFLWTQGVYENFIIELEFKVSEGGNGGIVLYANNLEEFSLSDTIEVQIGDNDYWIKTLRQPYYTASGAIFGIQAPYMDATKALGLWNKLKISCQAKHIKVWINGRLLNHLDLDKCTSSLVAPDGNQITAHLREKAMSTVPTKGHIGFQGKHSKGNVYYKNIKIKVD